MQTYVSTMGFHETRVTRPLLRNGLDDGDVVVLLRPQSERDSDRGANAVDYVEDMLGEIAPGATVTVETVDESDFQTAVLQCSDVLEAASGTLVVNFGGGAREIFLPLTIASLVYANEIDTALQYTDIDQTVREWTVPNLTGAVPSNGWSTLDAIVDADTMVSIPDLEDRLDTSKSTISRHVTTLDEAGLVETSIRGKTKHVEASLAGKLRSRAQ